jgi:WD40 repeat protein/tRNA A-37 threonylcarbamoyl transferase component Bud32
VDEEELRAYLLGELPEGRAEEVACHLQDCPTCDTAAARLDDSPDAIVLSLRRALRRPAEADTAPAREVEPPPWPRAVAGYEVLGELGRGGMSVVYRARQERPTRLVALKVILAGVHADAERRARFLAEADALARLSHPNIVQIYEVGTHDGLPFLALEYVPGGSLADRLDGTPQPPRRAAELVEVLARAVQAAHSAGIVHRDLKPGNVLLSRRASSLACPAEEGKQGCLPYEAVPKITDFGLAKQERPELTATGAVLGTPSYMAPEQAAGDSRSVGPAADVWALGALLYELLTGRPPFRGWTSLETLQQVRFQEPVPPSQLQGKTPRDLGTICLKCLQKEPAQRYATAGELADDLARFLDDRPIRARPVGSARRLWRACRRRPGVALLAAAVVCLLVAVAAVSSLSAWRLGAEAGRAHAAEQDATDRLFESYLVQARAGRQSGLLGQRFASLAALQEATGIARSRGYDAGRIRELRNEVIACLALADLRVVHSWPIEENRNWNALVVRWNPVVAFDPKLERYACGDARGVVRVRQVGSDREVAHLPGLTVSEGAVNPFWSPDGRFLAVNTWAAAPHKESLVWDLHAGRVVQRFPAGPECINVLAFSPDSRSFVTSRADKSIGLHDLSGGKERRFRTPLQADRAAFAPDGRRLACSNCTAPAVLILDVVTGEALQSLVHPAELWGLAWSPDGRLLAAGCDDRKAYVWDTATWRQQAVLEGHQRPVCTVAFSPSGEVLATGSTDGTTRLWDPISGTALLTAPGRCIAFDRTGRRLAFHKGLELGIWEVATGRTCRQLRYGRTGNRRLWHNIVSVEDLDFGAGGRLLAACGNDGVRFWDVAAGEEVGFLPVGRQEATVFGPGGKQLFTYGRTGLRSWPVEPQPGATATTWQIGPPRRLPAPASHSLLRVGRDRKGRLLAVNDEADRQVVLLDVARRATRALARERAAVDYLDLSPDGRWLAVSRLGQGIQIYDVGGNRRLEPPPPGMAGGSARLVFSPDGRWLVAGLQNDYRIWRVGRWQQPPRSLPRQDAGFWPGPAAYSSDGRLLAIARTPVEVQLLDGATFQEVARLLAPDARPIDCLRFSPAGDRLGVGTQNRVIQLWDLRRLRSELRQRDLDWDLPSYPDALPPGRLRVVLLPDTIEAENLLLLAWEKCQWSVRDTSERARAAWSNDRELFGAAEEGGYLELEVEVSRTGRYALGIYFTRGPDFGLVEVSVDGKKRDRRFDGFHEKVVRSGKIDFGTLRLSKGRHRLRFRAVGKNPRATGFHLAVDCLELLPVGE